MNAEMKPSRQTIRSLKQPLLQAALAAFFMLMLAPMASGQASDSVGEVSMTLGKAYIQSASGARELITRGSLVKVGDQISTESNGHVHIHFVDKALVSVRPNSVLLIERYDYDVQRPELSAVKFRLEEGITRAISGDAAKNARERFRLNTPIAAIGVRGTDFVVSTNADSTKALVNEGVIVMAPYSDTCSIDALGPCLANALELTERSLQMVALDGSAPLPRLLPAQNIRNPDMMREEAQQAIAGTQSRSLNSSASEPEQAQNNEVLLEGISNTTVTSDAEVAISEAAQAAEPIITDLTPDTALTVNDLDARQLVWGRYADDPAIDDRIALSFAEASSGRQVTVGNLDYGLFREEEDTKRVNAGLTVVGFELSSAQAFYNSDTGIVAMEVNGGSLNIDFIDNQFATELNLNHDLTGSIDFIASGRLFDGGYFHARDDSQRIAGAVSLDGLEAGYFFERQLEVGNISGLTLWDSQ